MNQLSPSPSCDLPLIVRLLLQSIRSFGDKVAFIDGERKLTYRSSLDRILRLGSALGGRVPAGERAIIFMKNCIDAALLPLALRVAGLISVPVNWRMTRVELCNAIEASGAALVLHDRDTELIAKDSVAHLRKKLNCLALDSSTIECDIHEPRVNLSTFSEQDANGIASIHFTSGTLGKPKGVMQSHRNWESVWLNLLSVRDFRSSDNVALTGPLSHAAGTYVVPLLLSGATILLSRDVSPSSLAVDFVSHEVTVLQCVPTLLTRLVASESFVEAVRQNQKLRLIIYGAESMPFSTLTAAIRFFGPIVAQNYGLTEAMMTCATLPADEHFRRNGSNVEVRQGVVGRPYPFVELVVRRKCGAMVEEGETGEITVRSPHVMLGYWRNVDATNEVLRDGWLWTGDLARWTPDGYLELVGRSKDMIICGGMNIYPAEVQNFLSTMVGVRECAAFGISSLKWGEELVAAIAIDEKILMDRETLRQAARVILGIRTPKRWVFVSELPRNSNGKIDYSALRELVTKEAAI